MAKKILRVYSFILIVVAIISFFLYRSNLHLGYSAVMLLFVGIILYYFDTPRKNIFSLIFLTSFFTFLLGAIFFNLLKGELFLNFFSFEIQKNIIGMLFISLMSFFIGSLFKLFKSNLHIKKNSNSTYKKTALILFYLTVPFLYAYTISEIIFVSNQGYINSYLAYSGPGFVISKLSTLSLVSFYFYLGCYPNKIEARIPIIVFGIYSILTILGGGRFEAVTNLMVLFAYFIIRSNYKVEKNNWISIKEKIAIFISTPLAIVFLYSWGSIRVNQEVLDISFLDKIIDFFTSQGSSIQILGYVQQRMYDFPTTNLSYTFGGIINWFKYNEITQLVYKFPGFTSNTVEAAMYANTLGETITYIVMPHNYLNGIGMGGSYLADLYIDFSFLGIIIFNLLLGLLLANYKRIIDVSPIWFFPILIVFMQKVLIIPRGSATEPIRASLNFTILISLFLIWFANKIFSKYYRREERTHENIIGT